MPSSKDFHSSSAKIPGATPPLSPRACGMHAGDADGTSNGAAAAGLSGFAADRYTSSLQTKEAVDDLLKKYDVRREFAGLPAGDLRASTPWPPNGSVCVYAHALEAGVRFPLHKFFVEVLKHYGLAPDQLAPSGWRVLVGFVALCHDARVRPSLAVFRCSFSLVIFDLLKGWYCFRDKDVAMSLFTGLTPSNSDEGWKEDFFFLTSPDQWPFPVNWRETAYTSSTTNPVLTAEDEASALELLGVRVLPIDLRAYLSEKVNLDAAFFSSLTGASPVPPSPQPSPRSSGDKGTQLSIGNMIESMRAEKLKIEPDGDTPPALPGKKIKQEHAGCYPPGFGPSPRYFPMPGPDDNGEEGVHGAMATRKVLESVVTPSRKRELTEAKPSDVFAATSSALLKAANCVAFSVNYQMKLEEKLAALDRDTAAETAALQEQVEKDKAELAAAKQANEAKLQNAKATAVQQLRLSTEHKRRLAKSAAEGYKRGKEDLKRVALRLDPHLDVEQLVVTQR